MRFEVLGKVENGSPTSTTRQEGQGGLEGTIAAKTIRRTAPCAYNSPIEHHGEGEVAQAPLERIANTGARNCASPSYGGEPGSLTAESAVAAASNMVKLNGAYNGEYSGEAQRDGPTIFDFGHALGEEQSAVEADISRHHEISLEGARPRHDGEYEFESTNIYGGELSYLQGNSNPSPVSKLAREATQEVDMVGQTNGRSSGHERQSIEMDPKEEDQKGMDEAGHPERSGNAERARVSPEEWACMSPSQREKWQKRQRKQRNKGNGNSGGRVENLSTVRP